MELTLMTRQSGKTRLLIQHSLKSGHTIVCSSIDQKKNILQLAAIEVGKPIPEPITYRQFIKSKKTAKGYLIDDLECFLRTFSSKISGVMISLPYSKKKVADGYITD